MVTALGNMPDEIALRQILDGDDGVGHEDEASALSRSRFPGRKHLTNGMSLLSYCSHDPHPDRHSHVVGHFKGVSIVIPEAGLQHQPK